MCQELSLLDEALALAKQEKNALEDGNYDQAIKLAEQRGKITNMAWNMLDGKNATSYRHRVMELNKIQTQLTDIASRAKDAIRIQLNRSRKEKKRIQGYHLAVGQALQ